MKKHILQKYLLKEALISFFAVLLVLILVLLGGVFIQLLGKVVDGTVELGLLFPLLFWGSLKVFSTLLVISLFLSILFSLGRLYKDSEIYAMRASGFGNRQLLMPFLWISGILALVMALLSFELEPWAEQHVRDLKAEALEKLDLAGITPGRFVTLPGQGRVVFAESLDPDSQQLQHLYLFLEKDGNLQVVAATTAEQVKAAEDDEKFLLLSEGEIFQGQPGADRFSLTRYEQMGIRIPDASTATHSQSVKSMSVTQLWDSKNQASIAEFHWRLSFPLSVLVLTLLAVPLSHASPRQGRSGGIVIAIIVYIFYANLLGLGKSWIEDGSIPAWMGLWWVHFLFLLGAGLMWANQDNYFTRWFYARRTVRKVAG